MFTAPEWSFIVAGLELQRDALRDALAEAHQNIAVAYRSRNGDITAALGDLAEFQHDFDVVEDLLLKLSRERRAPASFNKFASNGCEQCDGEGGSCCSRRSNDIQF